MHKSEESSSSGEPSTGLGVVSSDGMLPFIEQTRKYLSRYLSRRGCPYPSDVADSAINDTLCDFAHGWITKKGFRYIAYQKAKKLAGQIQRTLPLDDLESGEIPLNWDRTGDTTWEEVSARMRMECLRDAIQMLPSPERDLFIRHYVKGEKVEKISKNVKMPVRTVYNHLVRAREILKSNETLANFIRE